MHEYVTEIAATASALSKPGSASDRVTASETIAATSEAIFAVLADPSTHADIDGTGWVRESLDGDRITAAGQVFRMAMHHENHPDKDYKMANKVETFDEPHAISWKPGQESPETGVPPFPPDHLDKSLQHLSRLAAEPPR